MKKQILSEEFKRMQKLAGLITEAEEQNSEEQNLDNNQKSANTNSETEDELKDILKADYPTFVEKLGDNINDPKFRQAIKSIAGKNPIKTTDISPKVTDLIPTQNAIDIDQSLIYPLTKAQDAAVYLKGGAISIDGRKIITGGRGKFIIDGHHRWSQLYCINPEASITALDITNITDPISGLKATQLGIAGDIGRVPSGKVEGPNLLKIGKDQLIAYVVKTVKPEVLEEFKKAGKANDANSVAEYVWKNVEQMQQQIKKKRKFDAPNREIMPQTDDAKNWSSDAPNVQIMKEIKMNNIKKQILSEEFQRMQKLAGVSNKIQINEAWNSFLKGPKISDASRDAYKSQGFSSTGTDDLQGKNPTDYIMFNGKKFYNDDLLFAPYNDTGKIPRIEGDKLIISNPAWMDENKQISEVKEDLFNKYKSKIETLRDEFIADLNKQRKDLKKLPKEDKTKLSQMIRNLTGAVDDALSEGKKIKEVSLNPEEQKIFNDIISPLNEGTFDSILEKTKFYVKKGLMTAAILAALMALPNLSQTQKQDIRQIADIEMSISTTKNAIKIEDMGGALDQALKSTNPYVLNYKDFTSNVPYTSWNYGADAGKSNATVGLSINMEKGSDMISIIIEQVDGKSTEGYEAIVASAKTLGGKVDQDFEVTTIKISVSKNKIPDIVSFVKNNIGNLSK
jgi:hypothetical protein